MPVLDHQQPIPTPVELGATMNCQQCQRPLLRNQPSKRFEDVYATIVILWAIAGVMAAGGIIEAMMDTHWLTFLVTITIYALGTTVLVMWWKIKALG